LDFKNSKLWIQKTITKRKNLPIQQKQKKQNEDFRDIPASSEKQNPSDVDKEDVQKSSKNKSGKTDNTK